jgi:Trypsin-like peptidase domain
MIIEELTSGVITVGHGRGFVVERAGERLVITAAHCLPSLPPALPSFGPAARTYGPILARRGEEPRAWAVCRFVDPIADIAVLGSPDDPYSDDYKALMGTATALSFGDTIRHPLNFWAPAQLLSLDGRWFSCTIRHFGGPLWITHAAERVHGGMSGSPIVAAAGTAIGVVCTTTSPREGGPNARLPDNLPAWLLRDRP